MNDTELAEKIERLKAAKERVWKKVLSYDEPCPNRYVYEGQIIGIDAALKLFGAKK